MSKDAGCGCDNEELVADLATRHRKVLWAVLLINAGMFLVEVVAGLLAGSTSILADSLDMLGDAVIYAGSIYVIDRSVRSKSKLALAKGTIMAVLGIGVVIDALTRFSAGDVPDASAMTTIGGLALAANLACAILLLKYRGDDINMRSTWLCSRNDALASAGVVVAGFAVSYWNSRVPDLVVGGAIAVLVLHSSWSIVRESILAIKRSG